MDGEKIELPEPILDFDLPIFGSNTTSIKNNFVIDSLIFARSFGIFVFQVDFPSNCATHLSFSGAVLNGLGARGVVGFLTQEDLDTVIDASFESYYEYDPESQFFVQFNSSGYFQTSFNNIPTDYFAISLIAASVQGIEIN